MCERVEKQKGKQQSVHRGPNKLHSHLVFSTQYAGRGGVFIINLRHWDMEMKHSEEVPSSSLRHSLLTHGACCHEGMQGCLHVPGIPSLLPQTVPTGGGEEAPPPPILLFSGEQPEEPCTLQMSSKVSLAVSPGRTTVKAG